MLKSLIKNKIFKPLAYLFSSLSADKVTIHVTKPENIHKNAQLYQANLSGDISIGEKAKVHKVDIAGKVTIGKHTSLWGPGIAVYAEINPIVIGKYCSIARNVSIQEFNHKTDHLSTHYMNQNIFGGSHRDDIVSKGGINIGNDVWIGANSMLLSGVEVGDGAIIAANSVVTSDVPPYAIFAGNPARLVKYRFNNDVIEQLLKLQWWDWSEEKIQANKALFQGAMDKERLATMLKA